MTMDQAERQARLAWARVAEPLDRVATRLIERYGFVDGLDLVRRQRPAPCGTPVDRFAARLRSLDPAREEEMTAAVGARLVVPGDREWPARLDDLTTPPWCVWVRGPVRLSELERSASVVGARAATGYGMHVAAELGAGLADRGFGVVSGAAFGIDGAAHRGALAGGGRTVAVLACGVERVYPQAHATLLQEIATDGAVVSEVPVGSAPTRTRFLSRNRIIAALSAGTVLVEAGLRSGARSTTAEARRCARPVAVVPGPVTSMVSAGCHAELRETDAVLVTDADEIAELLGDIGADLAPVKHGEVTPPDELTSDLRRIWQSVPPHHGVGAEEVARAAGLALPEVQRGLVDLQLRGMLEQRLDGWVRRRTP